MLISFSVNKSCRHVGLEPALRIKWNEHMYERSNIPVSKSVEEQSWWDIGTSRGRGLDSVTLYRGFYVEIDNSPNMDVIRLVFLPTTVLLHMATKNILKTPL